MNNMRRSLIIHLKAKAMTRNQKAERIYELTILYARIQCSSKEDKNNLLNLVSERINEINNL